MLVRISPRDAGTKEGGETLYIEAKFTEEALAKWVEHHRDTGFHDEALDRAEGKNGGLLFRFISMDGKEVVVEEDFDTFVLAEAGNDLVSNWTDFLSKPMERKGYSLAKTF